MILVFGWPGTAVMEGTMRSGVIGKGRLRKFRFRVVDRSLMNERRRVGATTELWGMLQFTGNGWDRTPSTRVEMTFLLTELEVHNTRSVENSSVGRFRRRPCQSRSKVLETSNEIVYLTVVVQRSRPRVWDRAIRSPIDWRDRNPKWRSLSDWKLQYLLRPHCTYTLRHERCAETDKYDVCQSC